MVLADLVAFHLLTGQVCFSTESRPHNVICLPSVRCQNRTSRAHRYHPKLPRPLLPGGCSAACGFRTGGWRFGLGLGVTAEGGTGETDAAAAAAVGATGYPTISILLETVSPENNDASAFAA